MKKEKRKRFNILLLEKEKKFFERLSMESGLSMSRIIVTRAIVGEDFRGYIKKNI